MPSSTPYNQGMIFKNFKVPKKNLLQPTRGDGLTVGYHGLNRGRVAVCATGAAGMRLMLANMLPWAKFRKTYGEHIVKRELVRRRIGPDGGTHHRLRRAHRLVLVALG